MFITKKSLTSRIVDTIANHSYPVIGLAHHKIKISNVKKAELEEVRVIGENRGHQAATVITVKSQEENGIRVVVKGEPQDCSGYITIRID